MSIHLIPFGLRLADEKMVSVDEVERGLDAGCICPSCRLPLVARKSERNIKMPHFAHHTRGDKKAEKLCEYSLAMSVRLMMHQLSDTGQLRFRTPVLAAHRTALPPTQCQSRLLQLENIQIDAFFEGIKVDILSEVKGHTFVLYLTHRGRTVPAELTSPTRKNCGIVALDIEILSERFAESEGKLYTEILKDYLETLQSYRYWVYNRHYTKPPATYVRKPRQNKTPPLNESENPDTSDTLRDELLSIGLSMRTEPPRWTPSRRPFKRQKG
ncbi:hypothetical protein [Alteromonas antoniana]|uniref:hypothetical protein n=1 Tax=Alteromonas antoniana TaxID=2803813 RepID=UPI001C45735A|nr:hypothetical protein [Alteromonas antoniana]